MRKKKIEKRKKRAVYIKYALFSLFFILYSLKFSAQDSIPAAADLSEEKELKFQEFFFKALAEKSINNYQKAIENLENCNQVLPNNMAVYFEFSKNYLELNNTMLAKEYINRALLQEPENIWMLAHLVKIYKKDRNFADAIIIQEKIIRLNANKKNELIYLYLSNKEYDKALTLINEIQEEKGLTQPLIRLQNNLKNRELITDMVQEAASVESLAELTEQFEEEKSFETLKKIFTILENEDNNLALEEFSEKGISLFPAQPLVYLFNGKSLNNLKKHKEALTTLKNGIDFVIEDNMEASFYEQMSIASAGNGNAEEAKKYSDLAKKLKS